MVMDSGRKGFFHSSGHRSEKSLIGNYNGLIHSAVYLYVAVEHLGSSLVQDQNQLSEIPNQMLL